jgi:hypothetical protein
VGEDPVRAIKLLDQIAEQLKQFIAVSPGLADQNGEHPVNEIMAILYECRQVMFIRYGKMLWFTSDGPINKSFSEENLPRLSTEVLPTIPVELGTEDIIETLENGQSFQRLLRGLGS